MVIFINLFLLFWAIRTAKSLLFFVYLWQLKEYQVSRVLSHFETDKGKKIFLNKLFYVKIFLFLLYIFLFFTSSFFSGQMALNFIIGTIFLIYILESAFAIKNIRSLRIPAMTAKGSLLSFFVLLSEFFAVIISFTFEGNIYAMILWLFAFDVFSPIIASFIVLIIQPFVVFYRNKFVLDKARQRIIERKDLIVIGITGSYGKTSAKEFVSAILSSKFKVLKTGEHQNSEMGISQCILKELEPEHQIFVVEMGAYGKNGIKLLSGIAKPKIGILTGINSQHISLFGSQEAIIKTKYELIESLPKDGLAIFNGTNNYCKELYDKTTNVDKKLYGISDIWAENVKIEKDKVIFDACFKNNERINLTANVLGKHNVLNILAGILVAKEFKMSSEEIKAGVSKINYVKILAKKTDPHVIDSSYSANPDGVIADLEYLKVWPGKKAIVMPCLIELGADSFKVHQKIGKKIGEVCDLAIITTSECFSIIKDEAIKAGIKEGNILQIENAEKIINQLEIFSSPGDVVLLEGRVPEGLIKKL